MTSRLLLHSCCAHCAAYTLDYWRGQGYEVVGYWYNPNIHPYTEHRSRLEAIQELALITKLPLIVEEGYDIAAYFGRVTGHETERCRHCFELRLEQTAEIAVRDGFNAFTTTLLISPQQKHDTIRRVGEQLGWEKGVAFLYADLRKRYSDSRHMTKGLNLYRQQYCGCLFSEWERFSA